MTTASRAPIVWGRSRLCDVPQAEQAAGDDQQADQIGGHDQERLLGADGRRNCRGGNAADERVGILAHEQVSDPLVVAVADRVDEAHRDDLDGEQVHEPDAEGCGRLPDQHSQRHAEGAVDREEEPDGAEPLGHGLQLWPGDRLAFKGRDAGDESGPDQESRPKAILAPLGFDGRDHDPCFSPVSWKKTSSSDLSKGRSSLTSTPAAMSMRLTWTLFSGFVLRWMAPS